MDLKDTLPLLLDRRQVASLLNVRPNRVYSLSIPVTKLGPRTYRWHRDEVLRFVTAGQTQANARHPIHPTTSTAQWAKPPHAKRPWRKQS